jgi:hypothetical protein
MGISTFPASSGGGGGGASFKQITKRITSTQSFTVPADVTQLEVLLAGGGSGGQVSASPTLSGSGGSGSAFKSFLTVTPGAAYTVTIGAGGAGAGSQSTRAAAGSDSSFGALLTALGARPSDPDLNYNSWAYHIAYGSGLGGSGAGAGSNNTTPSHPSYPGIEGIGHGGASGWAQNSYTMGSGTSNGGGYGARAGVDATSALPNTGAGGGGSTLNSTNFTGGSGGSGVCIIKYWSAL